MTRKPIDDKEAAKRVDWLFFDTALIVIGIVLMFPISYLAPLEWAFITFFAGTLIEVFTLTEFVMLMFSVRTYVDHKGEEPNIETPTITQKLVAEAKRLQENTSGILWVWAVCFLTIGIMSIVWFTLSWPAFMIIDNILATYSFPPTARLTITLITNVLSYFVIIMVLGLLFWAFVNSGRREDQTYGM